MNNQELPDALKPYAQAIEAFGWSRFIPRYELASPEQQEAMRIAIWNADQAVENMMGELDIDKADAASLFLEISQPLWNLQEGKDG